MRRIVLLTALSVAAPALAQTAPPPAANPLLDAIGTAPSAANIERDIRTLVGFGTRHTLSDTASPTRGIGAYSSTASAWYGNSSNGMVKRFFTVLITSSCCGAA